MQQLWPLGVPHGPHCVRRRRRRAPLHERLGVLRRWAELAEPEELAEQLAVQVALPAQARARARA
jgi:hypothetical protein